MNEDYLVERQARLGKILNFVLDCAMEGKFEDALFSLKEVRKMTLEDRLKALGEKKIKTRQEIQDEIELVAELEKL